MSALLLALACTRATRDDEVCARRNPAPPTEAEIAVMTCEGDTGCDLPYWLPPGEPTVGREAAVCAVDRAYRRSDVYGLPPASTLVWECEPDQGGWGCVSCGGAASVGGWDGVVSYLLVWEQC